MELRAVRDLVDAALGEYRVIRVFRVGVGTTQDFGPGKMGKWRCPPYMEPVQSTNMTSLVSRTPCAYSPQGERLEGGGPWKSDLPSPAGGAPPVSRITGDQENES